METIKVKETTWDSGLKIIEEPSIEIEYNLLTICNKIQAKFPGTEFSILVKGQETDEGYYLTDDYVIPKQEVSASTVDYGEVEKYIEEGYNVVIHSHHNLGTFFSVTDRDYINCHFPCSVLYTNEGFTMASMSFKRGNAVFLMETKDITLITEDVGEIEGIENITKKTYTYGAFGNQHVWKAPQKKLNKKIETTEMKLIDNGAKIITFGEKDCETCNYKDSNFCLDCFIVAEEEERLTKEDLLFQSEDDGCIGCPLLAREIEEANDYSTDEDDKWNETDKVTKIVESEGTYDYLTGKYKKSKSKF